MRETGATKKNGVVVQLVRMPACHAGGREFESRPYRKTISVENQKWFSTLFSYDLLAATFLPRHPRPTEKTEQTDTPSANKKYQKICLNLPE